MGRVNFEGEGRPIVKYRDALPWAVQQLELSSCWDGRPCGLL